MTFKCPKIIIHDVLQDRRISASQNMARKKKPFFDSFKETMKFLEGNNNVILLIVASGIDTNPEWVKYIKQHPEWKVECHGWFHEEYTRKEEKKFLKDKLISPTQLFKWALKQKGFKPKKSKT